MSGILSILALVAIVLALIDAWKSSLDQKMKIIWTVIIIIVPLAGAIAYFVVYKVMKK